MWGEHYGWAVQREALAPGQATKAIVLRSTLGYTGEQPRMQILQHKDFVDAKVELYPEEGLAGLGQARRVPDRAATAHPVTNGA